MAKEHKEVSSWQMNLVEYLSYFLIFLTPLYINSSHWFKQGTPKTLLVIGTVFSMLLLLAWNVISSKPQKAFSFNYLHLILLVYFCVLTTSALWGRDIQNSFFGNFEQSLSLVLLYALGVFAVIVGYVSQHKKNFLINILATSFISGVIVAIFSFFDTKATLGNDSYVGAYLLFILFFGIGLFFYFQKYYQKALTLSAILVITLCPVFFNQDIWRGLVGLRDLANQPLLLLGSAMGATLGAVVAVCVFIFTWLASLKEKKWKVLGSSLLVLFVISILFTGYKFMDPNSKIHQVYVAEKTDSRFIFWDIASSGFKEKPLLGYGYGNYYAVYQKYFKPDIMSYENTSEVWVNQPHNVVYEYLATIGSVGTLVYFILFGYIIYILFRRAMVEETRFKYIYLALISLLVGYFIQNLFVFDTTVTYLMFFLVVGLAVPLGKEISVFSFSNRFTAVAHAVCVLLAVGFGFVFLVMNPWRESESWKGIMSDDIRIDKIPALIVGIDGISKMGNVQDTAYLYDKFFSTLEGSLDQVNVDNKHHVLEAISSMIDELEKESRNNPPYFRSELVLGKLANLYSIVDGKMDIEMDRKANTHLEQAVSISPKNVLVYLSLAQMYFIEGDKIKTEEYILNSLKLSPQYESGYAVADKIANIYKDKSFTDEISKMRNKWLVAKNR